MTVFDAYARYYDLINKDKDYAGEARYVHSLIQRYGPGRTRLLDIGCGTGRHAQLFSEMGLQVDGLDRSEAMISEATLKNPELEFHTGDVCSFRLDEKFEALFLQVGEVRRDERHASLPVVLVLATNTDQHVRTPYGGD